MCSYFDFEKAITSVKMKMPLQTDLQNGYKMAVHTCWCACKLVCMQSERVQLDEQARMKDIELNQLKSVKVELEQDLRDCRQTVDRVSHSCRLVCSFFAHFKVIFH